MGNQHSWLALVLAGLFVTGAATGGQGTPLVLDDFEPYGDVAPMRIFDAWVDGWEDAANGSIVGHSESPFAERGVVHGGAQSMIFQYDNSGTARISQAERTFDSTIDVTAGGTLQALTLWYHGLRGKAAAITSDPTGTGYTLIGVGAGIGKARDEFSFAYKQLTGNATLVARIDSVDNTSGSAMAGLMIRSSLDADSVHATVAVAPTNRAMFAFRGTQGMNTAVTSTAAQSFTLPHWIRLTRTGPLIKAEHSANGTSWSPIKSVDPMDPSQFEFFGMSDTVYVGLAVTAAREDGTVCSAKFSNVTITGNTSAGPIAQVDEVGLASNDPGPLYVGLVDAAGRTAYVYQPAGSEAVLTDKWTLWPIALSEFANAGLDLKSVKKMILGVGDRDNPQSGGTGVLYFDDIEAVRRMPQTDMIQLLAEDFEGLPLGPNKDEATPGDAVWTSVAPAGWTRDIRGVPSAGDPAHGVDEWEGWTFANQAWWALAGGDQRRTEFALAIGTVAVADSDEYDDKGDPQGTYNTFLSTPAIDVSGIQAGVGTILLRFDSSWRPEDAQKATITARFDSGDPIEVLRWESPMASPFYHGHLTSELVTVAIDRPAGAKRMTLTFGYFDASNNWWWAIDNVEVLGAPRPRTVALYEDFDGLTLGPNVDEGTPGAVPNAFTHTPPVGWSVDRSSVPGFGDPANDGVTEWAGWSFAEKDFWINTDHQRREEFTLARGNVAVADCDEWDDKPHTSKGRIAEDPYDTYMTTPAIDISAFEPGSVQLKFDSSWRPEYDDNYHQTANITASFDGGEPIEVLRWESNPSSLHFKNDNSTNETIVINLDNPAGARTVTLTFGLFDAGNDWWWAIDNVEVTGLEKEKIPVFVEDFEGLPLGPNKDELLAGAAVWTPVPPAGWTRDNSGVPNAGDPAHGVEEWEGWTFADRLWWAQAAEDQRRSEFTLGIGTVAVADSDEYDDKGDPQGTYNAFLSTPVIAIAGIEAGSLELVFDSSWRPEDSQTATITASYDGAPAIEVLRWESKSGSSYYHGHMTNEHVVVALQNPAGAKTVILTFGYFNAANNWWWAIDNLVVQGVPEQRTRRVFFANFEGLPLRPALDEAAPGGPEVWTKTAPAGWVVDDSGVPGAGDPDNDGVTEWAGWSFANKDWWVFVAADQNRSMFTKGIGTVAIADCDEWDDKPHLPGEYNAFLSTPAIDVSGVDAGSVGLLFDSSWRDEATMTATITVSYDGKPAVEVLRWESVPGHPNFHDDAENETVTVDLKKPAGARTMVITFGLTRAGNNWWWAIDNLLVTGSSGGVTKALFTEDFESVPLGAPVDEAPPAVGNYWTDVPPAGWVVNDAGVPGSGDPTTDGVTEWAGWSFVNKDWWVQVAEDQQRSQFVSGQGIVAVADPDEWDDLPHAPGLYNAFLSTPSINVAGAEAGSLQLAFDSSWRQEGTQTASVLVSYDDRDPVVVMLWGSEGGNPTSFKPDATNERVTVNLGNPAGVKTMVITFGLTEAGNNWWWAIDNIEVVGTFVE
ncbi:MAG: hypothetical protein KBI32_10090 [Phycisphaerae bacterium]|nr:hypothetical protein [Phycisphaerae bacterium]